MVPRRTWSSGRSPWAIRGQNVRSILKSVQRFGSIAASKAANGRSRFSTEDYLGAFDFDADVDVDLGDFGLFQEICGGWPTIGGSDLGTLLAYCGCTGGDGNTDRAEQGILPANWGVGCP